MADKSLYCLWKHMRSRCNNPTNIRYKDYGGRGIKACDRWSLYKNFYEDMNPRPKGLTLERRDNSLGYSPDNCYWATGIEQGNNKRNNRLFTINGVTKSLSRWAAQSGLKHSTVSQRFYGMKWDIERAINTPARARRIVSLQS